MGALDGIKVLDVSFYAPGRWATMILADLGAEVIGIEMRRGDRPATLNILDDDTHGRWVWYQRNKKSITLNLKTEEGKKIFYDLAKHADVIVESFRPGTPKRLGIDFETVKAVNPRIVYCSVTGFGQDGPYAHLFGHEPNYEALSGALGRNRERGGRPILLSTLAGDLCGGAYNAVVAVLSAVIHAMKTGKGQYIDVAITAGILPLLGVQPYLYWRSAPPYPTGGESPSLGGRPDFHVYETKDGQYVAISPIEPWAWEKLCRLLGREDLIPHFQATGQKREEVIAALTESFASKTKHEWVETNEKENIGISPVLMDFEETFSDPQMVHRQMVVEIDYAPLGKVKQIGIPFKMSETPPEIKWIPRYGEHTEAILAELGYPESETERLRDQGVIE